MPKKSSIGTAAALKVFRHIWNHPWIVNKMVGLQAAKRLFPLNQPRNRAGKGGKIHQLSLRITDLCNLRCGTCGQWGQSGYMKQRNLKDCIAHELPAARYRELFIDLVRHGHRPNVYLWGGEPTLYSGMMDVVSSATGLGLPVSIATNGHNLSRMADELSCAPLFLAQISIDGPDAQTHNRARPSAGNGNSFQEVESGLAALARARRKSKSSLPLLASLTVVSQNNYTKLVDIYRTFSSRVDLMVFYLSWWITKDRAREHDADFKRRFGFKPNHHLGWLGDWLPDDIAVLHKQLKALEQMARPWPRPALIILPNLKGIDELKAYYSRHEELFGYKQCISIYQAVELNSNGDMSPCRDYHDYVVGNVKQQTITQLWNSDRYRRFRRSLYQDGLMPVCSRCCGLMGF